MDIKQDILDPSDLLEVDSEETVEHMEFVSEFSQSTDGETIRSGSFEWSFENTRMLIAAIKKYQPHVGTMGMKTLRAMFITIADELSNTLNTIVSLKQVENRWKVLVRNYRKFQDTTLPSRKRTFEYAKEMASLRLYKHKFLTAEMLPPQPKFTLKSPVVAQNIEPIQSQQFGPLNPLIRIAPKDFDTSGQQIYITLTKPQAPQEEEVKKVVKTRKKKLTRLGILWQMRNDRRKYQEEHLKLLRETKEKTLDLMRDRLRIERERNEIMKLTNNKNCNVILNCTDQPSLVKK